MDAAARLEIYTAIMEIYKSYMVRSTIIAGLMGFSLGLLVCLAIGLGISEKENRKLNRREKKA